VQEKNKPEVLARLIDLHNIKLALVFCNTKSQVDQLVDILKTRGYFADALHGDMSQNQRDRVMNGFRNGAIEILVATDVAGRGIDVNNVEAVFNYDLPRDDEDYTHRIGRTARAGKSGTAFTFIVGKQIYNLTRIQRANGFPIIRQSIPTIDEIETTRINSYSTKINAIIEAGHLSKYINQIEILMGEDYTSLDISAALLKMIMEKENEGFDHTANFEIPKYSAEKRPANRGFNDNKYGRKEPFKKFDNNKPRFAKNESSGGDFKPFKKFDNDRPEFKKDEPSSGFKPFRNNDDNKPRFPKDESGSDFKPFKKFDNDKPRFPKDKPSGDFKPFKKDSTGKKKDYTGTYSKDSGTGNSGKFKNSRKKP